MNGEFLGINVDGAVGRGQFTGVSCLRLPEWCGALEIALPQGGIRSDIMDFGSEGASGTHETPPTSSCQ